MNQWAFALRGRAGRLLVGSWLGSALAFLALLVPKCPLCVAAYLCFFGVSASSARAVVQLGVPLCLALVAGSALATALFVAQRGRRLAALLDCERCARVPTTHLKARAIPVAQPQPHDVE